MLCLVHPMKRGPHGAAVRFFLPAPARCRTRHPASCIFVQSCDFVLSNIRYEKLQSQTQVRLFHPIGTINRQTIQATRSGTLA
ncbi:hypothetical protein BCEP4_220016 [Burkholderia cepacia]|nr:hypothetical protein BCEP4_220016 [Burkholderia cepacia]